MLYPAKIMAWLPISRKLSKLRRCPVVVRQPRLVLVDNRKLRTPWLRRWDTKAQVLHSLSTAQPNDRTNPSLMVCQSVLVLDRKRYRVSAL